MSEPLAPDEIDALVYEAGPDADHDALVQAVERIVADRLAAAEAVLARVAALAHEWEHESPNCDPTYGNCCHVGQVRAAFTSPVEEQP